MSLQAPSCANLHQQLDDFISRSHQLTNPVLFQLARHKAALVGQALIDQGETAATIIAKLDAVNIDLYERGPDPTDGLQMPYSNLSTPALETLLMNNLRVTLMGLPNRPYSAAAAATIAELLINQRGAPPDGLLRHLQNAGIRPNEHRIQADFDQVVVAMTAGQLPELAQALATVNQHALYRNDMTALNDAALSQLIQAQAEGWQGDGREAAQRVLDFVRSQVVSVPEPDLVLAP